MKTWVVLAFLLASTSTASIMSANENGILVTRQAVIALVMIALVATALRNCYSLHIRRHRLWKEVLTDIWFLGSLALARV
ncbi:hypothetical protein MBM_07787 [Drepanopeziza brunnea f. sp. 'multigermtubi' MB_m1]|uniref:Uncharacterized protein n=1 Tax=Marssonina brunnea f. sp. multigermtubi (strain MB_m1) TaxID=1072389 RepID=K1WA27_MARBU|nr:uncharacterized protein MBM_07787 [Drepanopeziza brunnea f. sp. 'multigermtubi' MB_m1]EKD14110.1 hypothetical protein MBM_07787 [Drepanopeziza brunnea f. sp. 'multigermtubi' MB_m1]